MNNIIKAIMTAKNLSPSRFADEIGVPRPVVSHVLAGRNKPSLDMIQKIARRFPELGTDWVFDENVLPNGIAEVGEDIKPIVTENRISQTPYAEPPVAPQLAPPPAANPVTPTIMPPAQPVPFVPTTKKIEKILVFYTDRTFDEYTPNQ
ncbi:MAG: helix-turn-helix transcriptional regulator [Cytophagales bacterium]|jgi:transcriptional regulator with XRE-family HTH domain|nr:helix-turn-helix transcriptional regulator [Cytophagales bacterium]